MTTTHIETSTTVLPDSPEACTPASRRAAAIRQRVIVPTAMAMTLLAGCTEYQASTPSVSGGEAAQEGASLSASAQAGADAKVVEARMRPVAAAVAMSGTPQVGRVVSGTYRWMADWPETESVHLWEAAPGPTRIRVVGRAREMMPSAGLRGVRIRYCVKPVIGTGASRLTGHKTCSAWTTVDGPKAARDAG